MLEIFWSRRNKARMPRRLFLPSVKDLLFRFNSTSPRIMFQHDCIPPDAEVNCYKTSKLDHELHQPQFDQRN